MSSGRAPSSRAPIPGHTPFPRPGIDPTDGAVLTTTTRGRRQARFRRGAWTALAIAVLAGLLTACGGSGGGGSSGGGGGGGGGGPGPSLWDSMLWDVGTWS